MALAIRYPLSAIRYPLSAIRYPPFNFFFPGFNLNLQVTGIDRWWERALAAGAEVVMQVSEMFWGARYGQVRDPYGNIWALNQPL